MRSTSRLLLLIASSALSLAGCDCGTTGVAGTRGILSVAPASLEFGAVTEFTQKPMQLSLENTGRGALTLSVQLEEGSSSEFTLGPTPMELASGARVDLDVTFAAMGPGEDVGAVIITSDQPERGTVRVPLHAGAIYPRLAFEPDPLAFAPATSPLTTKLAVLHNVGGATLHVDGIGVEPSSNPDFSLTPPMLPLSLAPDASVSVTVRYTRSPNTAEGLLEVSSDEPLDGGEDRRLRLLPDPAGQCADGLDNDDDGLTDFPDDIGCSSPEDGDEYNPPECVTGDVQPCGSTTGSCRAGTRVCTSSIWGGCDGGVRPTPETCNGLDDDCNGMSDESLSELCVINGCNGARACVPNSGIDGGLFTACIPISAMPETCNGLDDNCNGAVDEGVVQGCTVFGCAGVRICVPGSDGGFTSCMPSNPLTESCNGVDDDCNGNVDDLPELVCGNGQCRRVAPACVDGGVGACLPGSPSAEVCNGADDDCNGTSDDGVPALSCGVGACSVSAPACLMDGGMNVCVPTAPQPETCNNLDDDCDGIVDELPDAGCGCVPPPSGIVSWWPAEGNALDIVGPNHGTAAGGVTYVAGRVGQAFLFDGTGAISAATAGMPLGSSERALEFWVRVDQVSTNNGYFAGYGSFGTSAATYHVGADTQGGATYFSQWGTGFSTSPLPRGTWTHVVVTTRGPVTYLFLNGAFAASGTVPLNTTAAGFAMGRIAGPFGTPERLVGALDEVTVYDRALTNAEIASLAAFGKCR